MTTELNINPYYDDFDEFKNFHQIIFRPGYAVQARELTQLQTIIQDQIKKFGSHIFQQGSVVIPGNSFSDLYTPYAKLETSFGGQEVIPSSFADSVVVGATSGIRAVVRAYAAQTSSDPLTLYLSYLSGGGVAGQYSTFLPSEEIYVETNPTIRATVKSTLPTGVGSLAFIKRGVFFINGRFVTIADGQIVISKYDSIPSCRVLLKITEEIVTSNQDSTLLDPASGSFNFAAPGADRLKISLSLATLPLSTEINDDYIEIMRFNAGVLEEHARYPKYSELEKSLARRTYDESGDYVVNGFKAIAKEHLRTKYNNGVYTVDNGGDRDKFVYEIAPGKAYIKGFEVEKIAKTVLVTDKARTPNHVKVRNYFSQPRYGQYFFVTNLIRLPNFRQREKVELWSASTGGQKIGDAYVYATDLLEGDATSQNAVYKLFFHDVALTGSNKLHDVGRIVFSSSGSAKVLTRYKLVNLSKEFFDVEDLLQDTVTNVGGSRAAKVHRFVKDEGNLFVFRHDSTKEIPQEGDFITGSNVNAPTATIKTILTAVPQSFIPLVNVSVDSLKSIKNAASLYTDLEYTVWTNVSITTDGSGNGTQTITSATFVPPDTGIVVAAGPSGIVSPNKISLLSPTIIKITNGPANETVNILTQVNKVGVQPKSKVSTSLTLSNVVPTPSISLTVCDAYEIVSILDATGNDVSNSFAFDTGQRDYYYDISKLNLVGPLPTSNLTIQLKYFQHIGSGDFFCIDSYTTLGSDYISKIPKYRSTNTSTIYDLKSFLDFRPKVDGSTGLFSTGGASLSDFIAVDSILSTPVQYFVPRIDSVVLNKQGELRLLSGEPSVPPLKPTIPIDAIELYSTFIPAYTESANAVVVSLSSTKRYTMKDISSLETRISNVERLSILTSMENSAVNTEVIDPITGLNKFKSGYLVDSFTNPFLIADSDAISNVSSFYSQKFGPRKEGFVAAANIYAANGSANYQNTNGMFTLPYTETAFINQNTSTKAVKVNPFSAVTWEGLLRIGPEFDRTVMSRNTTETVNTVVPVEVVQPIIITAPPPPLPVIPPPPQYIEMPSPSPVEPPIPVIVPPVIEKPPVQPVVVEEPVPTYAVSASSTTINEGSSVTFTVTTTNVPNGTVLIYEISGTGITSADFSDGILTGSLTINSNTAAVTKTLTSDLTSESAELFQFLVKTQAGVEKASTIITVNDTSRAPPPTYTIVPSATRVTEGSSITFTVNTTNVSDGTVLYWEIYGNVQAADFADGILSGTLPAISGGTTTLTKTIATDALTESETFYFSVKTTASLVSEKASVWINIDDVFQPSPATYTLTPSPNQGVFNEGTTITFNVATTNVSNGTVLYWTIEGTGINSGDFSALSGTFPAISTGATSTSVTIQNDQLTEGFELFRFNLQTAPSSGVVYTTIFEITDTSFSPSTYTVTPTTTSVNEGSTVNFTITTTNVSNGTTLYWNLFGISAGFGSSDIVGGVVTGSVEINSNNGSTSVTIFADSVTEENPESFRFVLRSSAFPSGVELASTTISINDTSVSEPEPNFVVIEVVARDIGLVDGLDSGVVNNTIATVRVTQDEANAITDAMAGKVIDATKDVNTWLDVVATTLVATTEYGSRQWYDAVQNAVAYLRQLGYDGSPAGVSPGGEIYEMLDRAYNKAKSKLSVTHDDYDYTTKFPGEGV
jgi:hypothetical protein